MTAERFRHPIAERIAEGMLDVGDGHTIHWETSGNPDGKPVVLLHGGPGSGSSPRHRQLFDPARYYIVQFDQRNCGRSTPSAGAAQVDLATNTTAHLVADMEQLRVSLGVDRWLVWGGSWGTTLGLAYAENYPGAVSELILSSVVTTTAAEVDWVTRAMGRVFPERWTAFVAAVPPEERTGNLALAYNRLLLDPDPAVHEPAALAWCEWEDVHVSIANGYQPSIRYQDAAFRLCFARLVTHYWGHAAFLDDGELLRNADRLGRIPTFLAHGRRDISSPADIPLALAAAIAGSELFIADDEGHGGPTMTAYTATLTDRLAGG